MCFMHYSIFLLGYFFFFFNDTATTEIYTLSLHDALPISGSILMTIDAPYTCCWGWALVLGYRPVPAHAQARSEEHTSELQSLAYLVCRLLLEKKKIKKKQAFILRDNKPLGTSNYTAHQVY